MTKLFQVDDVWEHFAFSRFVFFFPLFFSVPGRMLRYVLIAMCLRESVGFRVYRLRYISACKFRVNATKKILIWLGGWVVVEIAIYSGCRGTKSAHFLIWVIEKSNTFNLGSKAAWDCTCLSHVEYWDILQLEWWDLYCILESSKSWIDSCQSP